MKDCPLEGTLGVFLKIAAILIFNITEWLIPTKTHVLTIINTIGSFYGSK